MQSILTTTARSVSISDWGCSRSADSVAPWCLGGALCASHAHPRSSPCSLWVWVYACDATEARWAPSWPSVCRAVRGEKFRETFAKFAVRGCERRNKKYHTSKTKFSVEPTSPLLLLVCLRGAAGSALNCSTTSLVMEASGPVSGRPGSG